MTLIIGLLVSAFAIIQIGCGGDKGTNSEQGFEGITQTDEYGQIIYDDLDDWQWDDQTDLVDGGMKPVPYRVYPAYPNPAIGSIGIRFQLPQLSDVELCIINIRGETIRGLVRSRKEGGVYRVVWDLCDEEGCKISPGIYRCIFKVNGFESYGDIEVEDIEPKCSTPSSYKNFADEHWDRKRNMLWMGRYVSATGDTSSLLPLPSNKNEEYYAMIGRYDQFVFGWDDCPDSNIEQGIPYWGDVISDNRQIYSELWENCH